MILRILLGSKTTTTKLCACNKDDAFYVPMSAVSTVLKVKKRFGSYNYNRHFMFERSYERNPRDDYDYNYDRFALTYFFDKFDESAIETHKNKGYCEKLYFNSEEECAKYCDWLNTAKLSKG